jgi:predicted methyltransferase
LPEEEYRWLTMTQGGVYTTDAITTDWQLKIGGLIDARQVIYIKHSTKCQTCNGNTVVFDIYKYYKLCWSTLKRSNPMTYDQLCPTLLKSKRNFYGMLCETNNDENV